MLLFLYFLFLKYLGYRDMHKAKAVEAENIFDVQVRLDRVGEKKKERETATNGVVEE